MLALSKHCQIELNSKQPYHLSVEPSLLLTEPYHFSKEPRHLSKEPCHEVTGGLH